MRWLLILLIAATNGWAMRADINGDGRVDFLDFSILASEWLETDMSNSYVTFNGTGYISVPDNDALDLGTGDFTICFWIKTTDSYGQLLEKSASYNSVGWQLQISQDTTPGLLALTLDDTAGAGGRGTILSKMPINDGKWRFIAIVACRTQTFCNIYFSDPDYPNDDPYLDTDSENLNYPTGTVDNTANLLIGNGFPSSFFSGSLDDLRIYKAALNATDIGIIYNGGRGTKYVAGQCSADASFVLDFDNGYTALVSDLVGVPSETGVSLVTGGVQFPVVYYAPRTNAPGGMSEAIKAQSMATLHRVYN